MAARRFELAAAARVAVNKRGATAIRHPASRILDCRRSVAIGSMAA